MKPFLLIISAPTGAGKTTIAKALADARPDSATCRVNVGTNAALIAPSANRSRKIFGKRKPTR